MVPRRPRGRVSRADGAELGLARHVTLTAGESAYGERSAVSIDHLVPDKRRGRRARWRVTTRTQFLPRAHFDERARARINSASAERSRRLYCIDLDSQQVIAALAYHLDDRPERPVLLTVLAFRIDAAGSPELFRESRACGRLLKEYLHAISARTGRGEFVDIDAPNRAEVLAELDLLGFRRAPRVKGFQPSGVHLRQAAQVP